MLGGLLTRCCVPQLSYISQNLGPLQKVDFLSILPAEISFKILRHLDAKSLCRAAQVSTTWRRLADDDAVWKRLCEQHIDRKCNKCGWGLPLLNRSKRLRCREDMKVLEQAERLRHSQSSGDEAETMKRANSESTRDDAGMDQQRKRVRLTPPLVCDTSAPKNPTGSTANTVPTTNVAAATNAMLATRPPALPPAPCGDNATPETAFTYRRPWKEVYAERAIIEKNWRCGHYTTRVLKGHTDGVMCLQFDDTYLCSGGYDATVRVWCIKTGRCIRLLKGHTRCVRALTFDDVKLVTASMDRTIRVWNYRTGECMHVLEGHTDGVVCVSADRRLLVSGSADATVKVWNFETGSCHTLRGHTDWVNAVVLYRCRWVFSGSDDTTVRLWDLNTFTCVRTFLGHVGQIQSIAISPSNMSNKEFAAWLGVDEDKTGADQSKPNTQPRDYHTHRPQLVTGSLDNTLRMFNLRTGECQRTFFGHVEGVWCLAVDSLRVVSGAHDKTMRIWDRNTGQCMHTLVGHRGAVTCIGLSDTRVVTGSDDCEIRIWDFGPQET
jgi:F-box/WD-40 domain protein MET30